MAFRPSPFERSPLATIGGIIIALVVLYVLFNIVGWIIGLLYRLAPLVLIAAAIIDYKVITSYVNRIVALFKNNVVYGLVATAATAIFYPFVFLYFLGMALFKKRVREARQEADIRQNGPYIDYEEVDEPLDTDYQELPPPPEPQPRQPRREKDSDYDSYFQ